MVGDENTPKLCEFPYLTMIDLSGHGVSQIWKKQPKVAYEDGLTEFHNVSNVLLLLIAI